MTTTTNPSNNPEDNRQDFVGKVRLKAVRDGAKFQVMDSTEAFLRGAVSIQTIARHPIKSLFMFGGAAMSFLFAISLVWGAIYIVFGRPGSVQFAWYDPTTWIPAASDPLRRPVGNFFADFGDYLSDSDRSETPGDGAGNYDAESFD
ncbi:MAG: hypothetical protein AAFQ61_05785 [Cyanobacteria bacterium J06626_23]